MLKNHITDVLDKAYEQHENCIIQGLSGFGKTASCKQWLEDHPEINGIWLDGAQLRTSDVMTFGKIYERNDLVLVGQKFSDDLIDRMCKPNTVIIVDDYHLLDDNAKMHVLLLCDGYAIDERCEDGFRVLPDKRMHCMIKTT